MTDTGKVICRLRTSNKRRFKRRLKAFQEKYRSGEMDYDAIKRSLASYNGHLSHGHTWKLKTKIYGSFVLTKNPERGSNGYSGRNARERINDVRKRTGGGHTMKPKRIISFLLAICLVAGLMPTAAFAATDTGKTIQLVDSGTAANIGGRQADNVYFGTYKQSSNGGGGYNTDPIKWRVLADESGKLFLLSDQNLDVFQYHTNDETVTW